MKPIRNFDNIQYQDLREKWDHHFNELHDELEECYYGNRDENGTFLRDGKTGWIYGVPKDFHGYNITSDTTPAEAKALFDQLHSYLWIQHRELLEEENTKRQKPYAMPVEAQVKSKRTAVPEFKALIRQQKQERG